MTPLRRPAEADLAAEADFFARLELEDYAACQRSFYRFVQAAWPIIEPGVPFQGRWYHRVICRALEAVGRGEIRRFACTIPPGMGKSSLFSVLWPVWQWTQKPGHRFLCGSHDKALAVRDTLRARLVIASPWFQRGWGHLFRLTGDQNAKEHYVNDRTGYRVAFGLGGGVTGKRADTLLLDDPHSAKDAMFSAADREAVLRAFDQELANRINDPKTSSIVVVMQRLHPDDLVGHVTARGGWTLLRLPMRFEPEDPCAIPELRWRDPRRAPGELLWPERYDEAWWREQEKTLGGFGIAAQQQQRPAPLGGGMVKLSWFRRFRALPSRDRWLEVMVAWDTASKGSELTSAPWVGATWVRTETGMYLVRVHRAWHNYPEGKRAVLSEYQWACANLEPPHAVVIEGKSTGSSLLQELGEQTSMPLLEVQPDKDKITRLGVESPAIEAGNVWLPESAEWLSDFEREIAGFPNSATADQADCLSMSLKHFREGGADGGPRFRRL